MNKQLEIETVLRQKIKELKKKSNARRNALRHLEKALKIKQGALARSIKMYECSMDINSALLERNNELLEELDGVKESFEATQRANIANQVWAQNLQTIKPWYKFWK